MDDEIIQPQVIYIQNLIGTNVRVAEEIAKYCQQVKTNSKFLNMKSYVLEKIDKTYNLNILKQYLDKITVLKHKVCDNTKDVHHKIKVYSSFEINNVLVDFKCHVNEDTEEYFTIEIDGETIVNDEFFGYEYCMVKKDSDITNFNLKHYHTLDNLSNNCALNECIIEDDETRFDEKDYIDYDKNKENEKGIIDLKLFVEVCKKKFPDVNPIEMFDMIMLCLIYYYKL